MPKNARVVGALILDNTPSSSVNQVRLKGTDDGVSLKITAETLPSLAPSWQVCIVTMREDDGMNPIYESRRFKIDYPNSPISDNWLYIASLPMRTNVLHLFEEITNESVGL
jgi:hypothetical protein